MATCIFEGNTDMYGLGIRLGFYLQWFGSILATFLVPIKHRDHRVEDPIKDEIIGLRFSNNVFAAATFLALVILLSGNPNGLQPVEIYIVLVLTFGYTLMLIPIYIWRLLIVRGDSSRDPKRWPLVRPSPVQSTLRFLLTTAVACFQLWFWFAKVPQLRYYPCDQYGFFLAKLRLNSPAMQGLNILLYFLVLFTCIALLVMRVFNISPYNKDLARRRLHPSQKFVMQTWNGIVSLFVAALVVLAVELTIKWNRIQGVNSVSSAGQTIPLAIASGLLIRVLYVYLFKNPEPTDERHWYREPQHHSVRRIRRYGSVSATASTESSGDVTDWSSDSVE